jgi:hypothetical protein
MNTTILVLKKVRQKWPYEANELFQHTIIVTSLLNELGTRNLTTHKVYLKSEFSYALQGLKKPSGPCSEGYFCKAGSTTATPDEESMGGECQPGFYCPEGM